MTNHKKSSARKKNGVNRGSADSNEHEKLGYGKMIIYNLGIAVLITMIFFLLWFLGEQLNIVPVLLLGNFHAFTLGESAILFTISFILIMFIILFILNVILRKIRRVR